ncbi:DUF2794 domain-containing protein [Kordiimonas aquimaris]|uniref:DUF2794 domain-containing protein n=1 Tax=Kordiimonas aquimaris TaxID=707591 RepID=UPI0021D081CA|nr:DUF2794 domain-containing protein [Kordiimonas aquimaris]
MSKNSSIYPLFSESDMASQNSHAHPKAVYFMRPELARILNVYGRLVSAGEWRDYAIDHLKDQAVFSIFRRASEMPVYRIIKEPARNTQQGMWRIVGMDGRILKRGHALDQLLRYFDRMMLKATD